MSETSRSALWRVRGIIGAPIGMIGIGLCGIGSALYELALFISGEERGDEL